MHKKIELVFPGPQKQLVASGVKENHAEGLSTKIDEIARWFSAFKVDSIELYISGAFETGGILKLFVSAKGEGGCKVTLKPKVKVNL